MNATTMRRRGPYLNKTRSLIGEVTDSVQESRQPCACGCGRYPRGAQSRFLRGHDAGPNSPHWKGGRRINSGGYVLVWAPDHHRADTRRQALEHLLVAEEALGHALPARAEVHHINGVRHDNRPSNLVICEDAAYHMLLHMRSEALSACGNAAWRKCRRCWRWSPPEDMYAAKSNRASVSPMWVRRACATKYQRARRRNPAVTVAEVFAEERGAA